MNHLILKIQIFGNHESSKVTAFRCIPVRMIPDKLVSGIIPCRSQRELRFSCGMCADLVHWVLGEAAQLSEFQLNACDLSQCAVRCPLRGVGRPPPDVDV